MSIQSFKCKDTKAVFSKIRIARFAQIQAAIERKLQQLDNATTLDSLRVPWGNHKPWVAVVKDKHSIRVNKRYRVCFVWSAAGPAEVEVIDYHSCNGGRD
jgi:proteic killer suppression protein